MAWEESKENIQPLREGRNNVASLTQSLQAENSDAMSRLASEKEFHLLKIQSALELDDPIVPYLQYIKWYKEVAPVLGGEFSQILRKCLQFFEKNQLTDRYSNDPRYIQIWLAYADSFKEPQDIYEHMRSSGIGTSLALFYEGWSRSVGAQGDLIQAEAILDEGIRLQAQPLKRLTQRLTQLRERVASVTRESRESQKEVSGGVSTHHGKVLFERIGSYRPPAPVRPPQERQFQAGGEAARENLGQESAKYPNKWIHTQLPSDTARHPAGTSDFNVYREPVTAASSSTNTKVPNFFLKERKIVTSPKPLIFLDPRPSERVPQPREKLCYPYWEVYPVGGQDISFEELRASREWGELKDESGQDMELTCMDRGTEKLLRMQQMRITPGQLDRENESPPQRGVTGPAARHRGVKKSPQTSPSCPADTTADLFTSAIRTAGDSNFDSSVKKREEVHIVAADGRPRQTGLRQHSTPLLTAPLLPQTNHDPRADKFLHNSSILSRSRSFEEKLLDQSRESQLLAARQRVITPGSIRRNFPASSSESFQKFSSGSERIILTPSTGIGRETLTPVTDSRREYTAAIPRFQAPNPNSNQSEIANSSIPALSNQLVEPIRTTSHFLPENLPENPGREDTSMTIRSRRADAEILELFATTLPSEKEEYHPPETLRVQKELSFKFHTDDSSLVSNRQLDASLMPPPSHTLLKYSTPYKRAGQGLEGSIDSSLSQRPTSTPMGSHKVPPSLDLDDDITQIQMAGDPLLFKAGSQSADPSSQVAQETQASVPEVTGGKVVRLSPINEASSDLTGSSKSGSLEEGAPLINPFDMSSVRRMVSEYGDRKQYGRLLDFSDQPAPHVGLKRTAEFRSIHFKILEQIGTGGFANVYLGKPLNSEAQSMSPEAVPVLKVIMKHPSCLEFLIADKIQSELCKQRLGNLCGSFYQPYSCIMYRNATILISEYFQHGTLLDLINTMKQKERKVELVAIRLALDVLYLIEVLHSIGIIHNDIKPDNFLLRSSKPITSDSKDPAGSLLHLIDFGSSIDLSLFPKNVQFAGSSGTDTFELPCMKEGKTYLHNSDSFGAAATLYCILAYEYPRLVNEPRTTDKFRLVKPIKSVCRQYSSVWDSLINQLMNARTWEAKAAITEAKNMIIALSPWPKFD